MFGFGMSAKDKWYVNQVEIMMTPLAQLMGQDVKHMAREIFDATKTELSAIHGEGIYTENLGDNLIATKKDLVEKRLVAGLTLDDIRSYWNQPLLMTALQNKFLELSDFVAMNMYIAQHTGKSAAQLSDEEMTNILRKRRKSVLRWGDPEQWNPALPINEGLTLEDSDIYIEFMPRVGRWRQVITEAEQDAIASKFSSYNAMVRDRIVKKII